MPEGHTIHLFANEHRRALARQRVTVSSPQGRFAEGAATVNNHQLLDVRAYGKNLFYEFDNQKFVHVHLGLHGRFRLERLKKGAEPPDPRGAVRMRIIAPKAALDLIGPIVCDIIDQSAVNEIIARLGPDVLDPKSDPTAAIAAIRKSARPIAELLMDQSILCGIGNAYRCELLYRQRLHPLTPGKSLTTPQLATLWADAVHLLKMGLRRRQAWAVDETDVANPPTTPDGQPDRYSVYRRSTCRNCGAKIKILPLAGRKCHYCPKEQKRKRPLSVVRRPL